MAWYCHCHWTRVIYALLGGTILWLFKMYPDFGGIFNMLWGLFLTCIIFSPSLSQRRWKKLELQVTSAQDLWADEWLICLTTDYTFLMYLVLYAVHLMAPSFVTSFLHILGCFTLTHQWWQQQEASIPVTKIKHTYQYHASRFASIQRTRRKFYFASDHHTQAVIHVY